MATTNSTKQQDSVSDLDTIAPDEGTVTVDGVACRVKRLRMRELMALVRVLTAGLGDRLGAISWDTDDEEAFGQQLLAAAIVGIPEAEDEACVLVDTLVEPVDPRYNAHVSDALGNPELETLIDVISTVISQEKDSFGLLLGKLRTLVGSAQALRKTGKAKTSKK